MNLAINGRSVLVTGGTRGIGEACAKAFLSEGCKVIITGTQIRSGWWDDYELCELVQADFNDDDSVDSLTSVIKGKSIDILVNNSGVFHSSPISKESRQQWRSLMNVNLEVPMLLIKAASVGMQTRNWGRIVNIGSIASIVTRAGLSAYATSKTALSGLTRAVALDLASERILVNCVAPAYTETDMLVSLDENARTELLAKVPLAQFAKPSDIASAVVFLASEKNQFITGQTLVVDGGVTIQ